MKKDKSIETLRGLAIILVVLGHVIGSDSTGGMKVEDDSAFRWLYFSLEYIRMPLFSVISGWVYARKPVHAGSEPAFIKGKLRRLMLPMLVLSTLLFLSRMVVPNTSTSPELDQIGKNLVFPYDVYWYLFSLFLLFLLVAAIDTTPFLKRLRGWATALAAAIAMFFVSGYFFNDIPNFFGFKGALYLAPYFFLGIGIYRFRDQVLNRSVITTALLLFIAGTIIQQLTWQQVLPMQSRYSLLALLVGLSSVVLLFRLGVKNEALVWIGNHAYAIFLFHVFFSGGTRIIMQKIGIYNQWIILPVSLVTAIFVSILAATILSKFNWLRLCFLGLKPVKKEPETLDNRGMDGEKQERKHDRDPDPYSLVSSAK